MNHEHLQFYKSGHPCFRKSQLENYFENVYDTKSTINHSRQLFRTRN